MKNISEKENFMMFMNGQQPLWVPRYAMAPDAYSAHPPAVLPCTPSFLTDRRTPEGGFDVWGVEHVATEETAGATMPVPNQFMLDDIRNWRDVVKAPDISHIDWEALAKRDLAHINRETTAVCGNFHVGYFQQLMAFMGFSEGLCAMFEEPEEVKALFQYMADFFVPIVEKFIEHYKPDIIELVDDTAAARNPFISVEMYRELIKPFHYQQNKPAIDAGLPIMYHNCGRCEDFIEDWFDLGIVAWNPAQIVNDLNGIKKKYGNRLGLCGCWDSTGPVNWPTTTREMIHEAVRDVVERFAPGGGYCFWGSTYGPANDVPTENRRRWLTEAYDTYGRTFYGK